MKDENKKVLFIINKFSGLGYSPALEGRIIEACSALKYECHIEFTAAKHHATELAVNARNHDFDLVFAVGGDGTVNEVATGLAHGSIPMGILPKGSGNGLARHLGISTTIKKALKLLGTSRSIKMDMLSFNGRLSANVSGIGFDGHIAGLFGKNGKRGLMNYAKLVMEEYTRYQEFEASLLMDGKRYDRKAFMIAFANSSQFGNNARVAPHASVCDQLMDVCVVRKIPITRAIGFAHKLFTGNLNRSTDVEIIQAKKVDIQFHRPMPCHIDGEAVNSSQTFSIEMVPASLTMLVPEHTMSL